MMASGSSQEDMLDDLSFELYGKPVRELTPPELKEFWEEVQRLNTKVAQGGRIGYFAGGPLVKKGIDALRKFKRPFYSIEDEAKMIMDLKETGKYTEKELMALDGDQLVEIYAHEGFTPPKLFLMSTKLLT